jgi:hypothetical protein
MICSLLYEQILWYNMQVLVNLLLSHPVLTSVVVLIAGLASFEFWSFRIRPLFIPRTEINATVDELIAQYGPRAEEMAFIEENRAWRYTDTYQQGKWRRVRRELWRRYRAGEWQ